MVTTFLRIPHHLSVPQNKDKMTGHRTMTVLNLKLQISYFGGIKCQEVISTLSLTYGLLHWQLTVMLRRLQVMLTCTVPLMQLLLVTWHGRASVPDTMVQSQMAKCLHG